MEQFILPNSDSVQGSIVNLSIAAAVLFLLPIVYAAFWKKRCGRSVSLKPLFIGAAGFLVTVRVLELGVHMFCIVLDNPVSRFINGSTPAFVIYGIFMAGIFEECGRYVIMRFLMKKNKTRENYVMYGIGHGGIEVWAISLLSIINFLVIAVMLKTLGAQGALTAMGISENTANTTVQSVAGLLEMVGNFSLSMAALNVFERIFAMAAHIALTVIVAYGVESGQIKYLFGAILAHAVFDIFPALYQRGAVTMAASEIWLLFCVTFLAFLSRRLYRRFPGSEEPADLPNQA